MPEFKFTDSQRQSLKICELSVAAIDEIEQLVQSHMLLLKNLSNVKYRIKANSIKPIRDCISKLHKLVSNFDKDDMWPLLDKKSLLNELELAKQQLMKIPKAKSGNKVTNFTEELDVLASEIARIMIKNGMTVEKRAGVFEPIVNIVFKATGFKRKARTAIKNRWWRDIEDWAMFGLEYQPVEDFEEHQ